MRLTYYVYTKLLKILRTKSALFMLFSAMFIIFLVLAFLTYPDKSRQSYFGVSFSSKYAEELGVSPRKAYLEILDGLDVRYIRLMSYWDRIEPTRGTYDFDELDWQISEAAKRGVKVTMAIGVRQPRYPECHFPSWIEEGFTREQIQKAAFSYVSQVVGRYRDKAAIISWQPENEALNQGFGLCRWVNRSWLKQEYRLIRSLDNRPIISNLSDEIGLPLSGPLGEQVGFSVYKKFWESKNLHRYLTYPIPTWFHRLRASVIERYWRRNVIIHELQAEPWGPKATHLLSIQEQDKTMDDSQMIKMAQFARNTGIKEVYLWGAEWWYWRRSLGDDSLWKAADQIINHNRIEI